MPFRPVSALGIHKSPAPFSPATVTQAGVLLHISGQVSQDVDGRTIGVGDVGRQTEAVIENIRALVTAAGGSMADIFRVTIFLLSRDHLPEVIRIRRQQFAEPYPAATVVIVSGLANPEWLIEIEATASLPS